MNSREAKQQFKEADRLFRAGDCRAALTILAALDREYPGAKNVLYPMALCYARLGYEIEALQLCEQLIRQFRDRRAETLKRQLSEPTQPLAPAHAPAADTPAQWTKQDQAPDVRSRWRRRTLAAVSVAILLILLAGTALFLAKSF